MIIQEIDFNFHHKLNIVIYKIHMYDNRVIYAKFCLINKLIFLDEYLSIHKTYRHNILYAESSLFKDKITFKI